MENNSDKINNTDLFSTSTDDQMADNKENNDEMSESDYFLNLMNMLRMIDKKLDERAEILNKGFDMMDKRFVESNTIMNKQDEKWEGDGYQLKESTEVESKQVSDSNVVNDSEGIINQVSDNDNSNNEFINNSDKIVGEVVLTSEDNDGDYNSEVSGSNTSNYNDEIMLNNNNDIVENKVLDNDEIEIVSERERVIGCNGVVISGDELEKEWQERLDEYVGQMVNCPHIYDEPRCSQRLLLKGKRPLLMEDLSGFPFLFKLVPSVWNGVERVRWCYDERDLDRELCVDKEIELYQLKRNYNEWKEMLEVCLNNNNLIYDEKITDPILNIITNGDCTEINNVDLVYDYYGKMDKLKFYGYYTQDNRMWNTNKIENCYLTPRLNFDDGG